jgi:hypothetical protein
MINISTRNVTIKQQDLCDFTAAGIKKIIEICRTFLKVDLVSYIPYIKKMNAWYPAERLRDSKKKNFFYLG